MILTGLADIYPLSALQQLWLANGRGPRRAEQHKHLGWQYVGALDVDVLSVAWQAVTDRHEVLRSAFFWQGLDEPVQIVFSNVAAAIAFHDFSGMHADRQEERLVSLLGADRDAGFDLASPPLNRLIVVKISNDLHRLVWSLEGPIVDSWSQPIVIKDLFRLYAAGGRTQNASLPSPPPYRDFIAWRTRCSFEGAEQFWQRELAPFTGLTSVCDRTVAPTSVDAVPEHAEQVVPIDGESFAALDSIARTHHLTLNALVMGAWAIVLARHCVTDFVTFGITLAGRSPSVPGVERMVGFFMNILPVAARIARDECYLPWAAQLQTLLLGVRQYEHLPATLPAIWCSRGLAPFLFDSLFVFENYPVQTPGEQLLPGVDLRETQGIVLGNFPLTVVVSKGWEWLQMLYDATQVEHTTVSHLLRALTSCLRQVAASPHRHVGDLARSL